MSNKTNKWIGAMVCAYLLAASLPAYAQPCPPPNPILGANQVCPGSQTPYTMTFDNRPTSTYSWELFGTGGQILGITNGISITIQWQDANGGPYLLRCTEQRGMCLMQNELQISVADDLARRPFNCFSELSIPFDENCEKLILPEHLLTTGAPDCANSFRVELSLDEEIVVPNPVGIEFLGQIITAKVIHVSSGRSCISSIVLKDGSAPDIFCENDTTLCNDPLAWDPFHPSFKRPFATDNCTEEVPVEEQGYEWIQLFDDPVFDAFIVRSWQAIDKYNNRSTCQDTVFLRRVIFDQIVCPRDTIIACDSKTFRIDHPLTSGVPTYAGYPLWSSRSYCDFSIKYKDQIIHKCPGTYTIHRYWYLSQVTPTAINEDTCHQIIEVVDTVGPTALFNTPLVKNEFHTDVYGLPITRPYKTVHFPTLDYECLAYGYFPTPTITDNCTNTDSVIVDLIWENGHINYTNGSPKSEHLRFENLEKGKHIVTIKLRDACHNTSYDTLILVAEDKRAPYIVVDKHPVITLASYTDITWIDVSVFDEGTWDNCYLYKFLGRRKDWKHACGYTADTLLSSNVRDHYDNFRTWLHQDGDSLCVDSIPYGFSEQIPFCCADACEGNKVTIELIAIDANCNVARIWVDVIVEDKSAPEVQHLLPDLNISCWAYNHYYRDRVAEGDFEIFGKYEPYKKSPYAGESGKTIITDRLCGAELSYEENYQLTYDTISNGLVLENCDLVIDEYQKIHFEPCGEGWIERHFVFKGACNSTKADSTIAIQRIYIYNDCPLQEYEIIWPAKDTTIYGCTYVDVKSALPRLKHEDECRQIGIHYEDQIVDQLYNADSTCLKVIRTWAVIDWCRQTAPYHEDWIGNQNYHYYEYEQFIYIKNTNGPVIEGCDIDTVCIGYNCTARLQKTVQVLDDCTPSQEIEVSWVLYEYTEYGYLPFDEGTSRSVLIEGLNLGKYKLVWKAQDACHNVTYCTDDFTVTDCEKPTPICLTSTTLRMIPLDLNRDGLIDTAVGEIWAEELNQSSYDNCKMNIDFRIRLKGTGSLDDQGRLVPPDSSATKLRFGCEDIGIQEVEMWVIDQAGNADFCLVSIRVQAPVEGCKGNLGKVKGTISSIQGSGISDVNMVLQNENEIKQVTTNSQGTYDFLEYAMDDLEYELWPEKYDDPINGINTSDVIRIAKHILFKEPLKDALQLQAADVNGDGEISVLDIITLRKLILGKIDKLPNTSWKFFNKQMQSSSKISIESDYKGLLNFTGVKIGDVNGDITNYSNSARSNREGIILQYVDQYFVAGEEVIVPLQLTKMKEISGLQMELSVDQDRLEIISFESDQIPITSEDFNQVLNQIYLSWGTGEAIDLEEGSILRLRMKSKRDGLLSESLALTSNRLGNELYGEDDSVFMLSLLPLLQHNESVLLAQNKPNPFKTFTTFEMFFSYETATTIRVSDQIGHTYILKNHSYEPGRHLLKIDRSELGASGVYVLDLMAGSHHFIKKIILLE